MFKRSLAKLGVRIVFVGVLFLFMSLFSCSESDSDSTNTDTSSTDSGSSVLTVSQLTVGQSYYLKAPNAQSGFVKWVEYGDENELGVRNANEDASTEWYSLATWTVSTAVDTTADTSLYSLESGYQDSSFIYAIGYSGSDDDVAHVYSSGVNNVN